MGRRKVDPANRLRAARACLPCKQSKKRCNAHWPCSNCLRRGIRGQCVYDENSNHETHQSRPAHPITPPDAVDANRQSVSPSHPIGSLVTPHGSSQDGQQPQRLHEAVPIPSIPSIPSIPTQETNPSSPEIRHQLHPRLLRDGHGEKGKRNLSMRAHTVHAHLVRSQSTLVRRHRWPSYSSSEMLYRHPPRAIRVSNRIPA